MKKGVWWVSSRLMTRWPFWMKNTKKISCALQGVGESSLSDSVIETTKQRLPWLAVNLFTAILASLVIAIFEDTIATFVALAVLMPIVASMGGKCRHAKFDRCGACHCNQRLDGIERLARDHPRNFGGGD
jgi:hypothetical protein